MQIFETWECNVGIPAPGSCAIRQENGKNAKPVTVAPANDEFGAWSLGGILGEREAFLTLMCLLACADQMVIY